MNLSLSKDMLMMLFGCIFLLPLIVTALDQSTSYNDGRIVSREKRETGGSGDFDCSLLSTSAQICKVENSTSCTCQCNPGYYKIAATNSSLTGCSRVKTFVGVVTFVEDLATALQDPVKLQIEEALKELFMSPYLVNAKVTSLARGSTIASYELYFQYNADVDVSYVNNTFYSNNNCNSASSAVNGLTLDLRKSCLTAVSRNSSQLCSSPTFQNYCNNSTSSCVGSMSGIVACQCYLGFYQDSLNSDTCVAEMCTTNAHCNSPFGSCIVTGQTTPNYCRCMWGFMGTSCYAPWMFVFTIVTAGCGVIILALLAALCCCKRKDHKSSFNNTYRNPDTDLNYQFADFQPGAMRARVPSSNDFIASANQQEMKSTNKESQQSRKIHERNFSIKLKRGSALVKNGQTNYAFEGSLPLRSTTFGTPRRSIHNAQPNDYF